MDKNMNIQKQKFQTVDNSQKVTSVINLLGSIAASHFPVGDSMEVATPNLALKIEKLKASDLQSEVQVQDAKINLPTFCEMENKPISIPSTKQYNPSDEQNCTNKILTLQVTIYSSPVSGHNGKNESRIGLSKALGMSLFDETGTEIKITNSKKPFEMWVPRDSNLPNFRFIYVNVTNTTLSKNTQIMPNSFVINEHNASVHIQIKPETFTPVGYIVLFKFKYTPILNSTHKDYNYWKLLCPQDMQIWNINKTNVSVYNFYLSPNEIKGYRGFVGYGLRELSINEMALYCSNSSVELKEPPFMSGNDTKAFQNDYSVRVFTSGCYYYDKFSGKWNTDGVDMFYDTNLVNTHCQTTHLTEFAGGLVVLPSAINFEHVFKNPSFLQNPIIYSIVIGLVVLYILFAIWAYLNDRRDKMRMGITVLDDRYLTDNYYYEIIAFTGNRKNAATDSKVSIIFSGDKNETEPRELIDKKRKVFRRGGVDSFILGLSKPLGNLNYVRVWHDNSGLGNMASWYLKFFIIHDLQTRDKYYFLCDKWLALEKGDGVIDRILPVAGEKQKTEVKYLIKKQAKQNMRDGHLWFSVFARPVQSTFTRLDRVTCCFVLLCISMLMNILYYGMETSANPSGLDMGPFKLTTEQIGIGIMTNLLTFPPTFLLIQLFRRSKSRSPKSSQIKKILREKNETNSQQSNTK